MTNAPNANLAHHFLDRRIEEGFGCAVALRTPTKNHSYAQIQELSLHYAKSLLDLNLERQARVLIALPEGADWVGMFFAALRCGAVVVMANPNLAPHGLAQLAAHTHARIIVARPSRLDADTQDAIHLAYRSRGLSAPIVFSPTPPCESSPCPALFCAYARPEQSAIWLFSGGTTAQPKAVMQSHGSFAFTTKAYAHGVLNLGPKDITISVPKLHFGYATGSNLLFPFSVGASCVLNPEPCNARALAALIEQHQATLLVHVPTMVAKMLDDPGIDAQMLRSLRLATSAGEALPAVIHRRWNTRFGIELLDGLGTAEMWHIFLSNRPGQIKPGSLGRAVPGFELRLRDDQGQTPKPGAPGWLWVKGGARAQGYWNAPKAAQEAFVGDWYRTGDLLTQDSEGYFYYCGRQGDLIKVSGQWLAPADVENALVAHDHVASAVVVGAKDKSGLQKPYAFVTLTPKGKQNWNETQLRDYVAKTLEPFKAPRAIFAAHEWPKTHLGKADRNRLRAMVPALLERKAIAPHAAQSHHPSAPASPR